MTKKDTRALIAEEAEAIDADRDAPITAETKVTRGHGRSKVLQIRLNPEELEELDRHAARRGLPTSTVAREAILRLIRPTQVRAAAARRMVDIVGEYLDTFEAEGNHGAFREAIHNAMGEAEARPFDAAFRQDESTHH